MKQLLKLISVGIIAGGVLAGVMKMVYLLTGNRAYLLLYNMDYIPFLKDLPPQPIFGIIFHFLFCIASVLGLFYLLKVIHVERRVAPYVIVYTGGAAILFFLSALTEKPPAATDFNAWFYWTFAHLIYSGIVGFFIKFWSSPYN